MSKINNEMKNINKAIFSALKESAQAEASRWESEELPSTTNGTARQEIEDQLERTRNRKERVGIEESSYKDKDEAEYYRNKELYANSNLARHREAMSKAAKKCKEKGIKLDESAPYRRYRVSFYVDTNEMNNMDIEERLNEVLKGSGLASTDETIDVELIDEFEESSLKEERVNMKLHKGDTFMNDAGVKVVITDVDEEHLLDGEPQVTYYFSNYGVKSPEDYKCFKMSSVVSMLNQNSYKRVD